MNKVAQYYKYGLSPTSQFFYCYVPFRLDVSPKCETGCLYCFSSARGGNISKRNPPISVSSIENKFKKIFDEKSSNYDIVGELIKNKVPIHMGGLSDPFSNIIYLNTTRKLINLFIEYDYPIIISTKRTQVLIRNGFVEILEKLNKLVIQISLPIPDDSLSTLIEPNAPVFSQRLKDIQFLINKGFKVIVRIQPVIIPLINKLIKIALPKIKEIGCNHVVVECLKIPLETTKSIYKLFKTLNWDGYKFYKDKRAVIVGRDRVLSPKIAWYYIKKITDVLNLYQIDFATTDHGLFHLSKAKCCCGTDGMNGFENILVGNFANIIKKSKNDLIYFSDLAKTWCPSKTIRQYINSNSRLEDGDNFYKHLLDKWNKPGNVNAPDSYLGVNFTGKLDGDMNCIYDKSLVNNFQLF